MLGVLARPCRLPLLAAVCAVVTCPVAGCSAVGGGGPAPGPSYYRRQVVYRLASGWVLLPAGYGIDPAVRPIPVRV